jgi:hypothetical protein
MRFAILVVLALLAVLTPSAGVADPFCLAPLTDWQPPDALQAKLEAEGWRGIAIRVEDGCYLVHASNDQGDRLHGRFDPATLMRVGRGQGHRWRGGLQDDHSEE